MCCTMYQDGHMNTTPTPVRRAVIARRNNEPSRERVEAYLPGNYWIDVAYDDEFVLAGTDVAGWTLDDYVIPRLASGLIFAEEV